MIGVSCVASAVGGIGEYVRHGESGFLYRFEEYEIMARFIEKIFNDDELSQSMSDNARADMIKLHGDIGVYNTVSKIYNSILDEERTR